MCNLFLQWEDVETHREDPVELDDLYYMKLTHKPTGIFVHEYGPSPYQLKMRLFKKLQNDLWIRIDNGEDISKTIHEN